MAVELDMVSGEVLGPDRVAVRAATADLLAVETRQFAGRRVDFDRATFRRDLGLAASAAFGTVSGMVISWVVVQRLGDLAACAISVDAVGDGG